VQWMGGGENPAAAGPSGESRRFLRGRRGKGGGKCLFVEKREEGVWSISGWEGGGVEGGRGRERTELLRQKSG